MDCRKDYEDKISELFNRGQQLILISKSKFRNRKEMVGSEEEFELRNLDTEIKTLQTEIIKKFPYIVKKNYNEDYTPPEDNSTFNERVTKSYESGIDMGGSWTGTDKFGNS